jgi:hypothetical protein
MYSDMPPKLWMPERPAIVRRADKPLNESSILVGPPSFRSVLRAATLVHVATTGDINGLTNYTFTNHAIGTAATGRRVLVFAGCIGSGTPRSISSITIGGVTATILVSNSTGNRPAAIAVLQVDTGTTATIVVNTSGTEGNCLIGVWSVVGLNSDAAYDTAVVYDTLGTEIMNLVLDVAAGGVVVAGRMESTGSPTFTWSGLTENYDSAFDGVNGCGTTASAMTAAAVANQTYTVTSTGSTGNNVGLALSMR